MDFEERHRREFFEESLIDPEFALLRHHPYELHYHESDDGEGSLKMAMYDIRGVISKYNECRNNIECGHSNLTRVSVPWYTRPSFSIVFSMLRSIDNKFVSYVVRIVGTTVKKLQALWLPQLLDVNGNKVDSISKLLGRGTLPLKSSFWFASQIKYKETAWIINSLSTQGSAGYNALRKRVSLVEGGLKFETLKTSRQQPFIGLGREKQLRKLWVVTEPVYLSQNCSRAHCCIRLHELTSGAKTATLGNGQEETNHCLMLGENDRIFMIYYCEGYWMRVR
ncbi:hypothetical protein Plhal703r1_c31g0122011 [Plasmopara halstedii]